MRRLVGTAASVLVGALLLTGCVGAEAPQETESSTAPETTPSAEPETTESVMDLTLEGTGYSLSFPEGWLAATELPAGIDIAVLDRTDNDAFRDNITVTLVPAGLVSPEQMESGAPAELERVGATDITVGERRTVAGSESVHIRSTMTRDGNAYILEQFTVASDDQTYIVGFGFSSDVPADARSAVIDSVLDTWEWL